MPTNEQRVACVCLPEVQTEQSLLAVLEAYSPSVEEPTPTASGLCLNLDARGVTPRYASEEAWCKALCADARQCTGVPVRLGLAGNKFAAWVAACCAPAELGYGIVTQSDAAYLAPLPVAWLPLDAEVQRRLRLLGLYTMGQFAALPRNAVATQFGPESLLAHQWARGRDERPVLGRRCHQVQAQHDFEETEVRREALVETAVRLAERALRDLPVSRWAWSIRQVALEATTEEGEQLSRVLWLGDTPGQQTVRTWLAQLVDDLQIKSRGIAALTVHLVGVEPSVGRQLDLFAQRDTQQRLEQALCSLVKQHTPACVLRAEASELSAPLSAERYLLRAYLS